MSNVETSGHSLGEAIERLRGKWASITAFGVLLVVLGFAALFFSLIATIATVTLNGVLFLIAGAAEIGIGMHSRGWGQFFLWVIGGILYLAAGVLCIVNPLLASVVLTLLLGAGLVAAGARSRLSRHAASGRPAAHAGFPGCRRNDFARFDHCQSLAAGQRLCVGNPAGRRPFVSRGRMGQLWYGTAVAKLTLWVGVRT